MQKVRRFLVLTAFAAMIGAIPALAQSGLCLAYPGSTQNTVTGGQTVQGYVRFFYEFGGACSALRA